MMSKPRKIAFHVKQIRSLYGPEAISDALVDRIFTTMREKYPEYLMESTENLKAEISRALRDLDSINKEPAVKSLNETIRSNYNSSKRSRPIEAAENADDKPKLVPVGTEASPAKRVKIPSTKVYRVSSHEYLQLSAGRMSL